MVVHYAPSNLVRNDGAQLTLLEINAPEADNALYCSELLSLDALVLTAMNKYRQEQCSISPVDFTVDFDDPLGAGV